PAAAATSTDKSAFGPVILVLMASPEATLSIAVYTQIRAEPAAGRARASSARGPSGDARQCEARGPRLLSAPSCHETRPCRMPEPLALSVFALRGVAAGALIGCVGIGGVIIVPALVYLLDVPIHVAIAAAMFAFLLSGVVGTAVFARNRSIRWD